MQTQPTQTPTRVKTPAIRKKLLAWFDGQKRQLPWRGTRDPYRIWVSEVMLQQTTVGAVRRRYDAFLERFPNVATLARARQNSVLAAWSGLGYYARARNLHRSARLIVRLHGGRLPNDPDALRALPGFGRYMAAAVASLAFGRRIAAADANVTRVLSRLFAVGGTEGTRRHVAAIERHAAAVLSRSRPGEVTAALMDLGQLICTPRRPDCGACPLAAECEAFRRGRAELYPRRAPKPPTSRVFVAAACAVQENRALLIQKPGNLLRDLWQFPAAEGASASAALRELARELATLGLRPMRSGGPFVTQHTIMSRRLDISVYRAEPGRNPKSKVQNSRSSRWFTARQLAAAAIPTLTRKIAHAAGFLNRTGVS